MMKKYVAGIVAIVLTLSLLAACTIKPKETDEGTVSPGQTPVTATAEIDFRPEETAEPVVTQVPQTETPAAEAPTTEMPATEEPAELSGPSRGTWSGNVYHSEFTDLSYTLPEGWIASTDEEIAAILGIASEAMSDEEAWMLEIAELTTIYDMLVMNYLTGENIIIMYENLELTSGGFDITEPFYIEILKSQLEAVANSSFVFEETYETEICGHTYTALATYEENSGMVQYYYLRILDDYMVGIIVTVTAGDIDDIMSYFA